MKNVSGFIFMRTYEGFSVKFKKNQEKKFSGHKNYMRWTLKARIERDVIENICCNGIADTSFTASKKEVPSGVLKQRSLNNTAVIIPIEIQNIQKLSG